MSTLTPKSFLFAATTSLALMNAPIAHAADTQDRIVEALQDQGFSVKKVKRTWLGRVRIEASGGGLAREVVFNPSTGEILRDFWEPEKDKDSGPAIVLANPRPENGGGGSVNEATDDDNNSGSGSGGGSGSEESSGGDGGGESEGDSGGESESDGDGEGGSESDGDEERESDGDDERESDDDEEGDGED